MPVRIPGLRTNSETLARVLENTKGQTGYAISEIAGIMSSFLENVALEVSQGRVVVVPGFGAFGQKPFKANRRVCGMTTYPAFYPYKGFRADVHFGTPISPEALKRFLKYAQNNRGVSSAARVSSAMGSEYGVRRQFRFEPRENGDGSV